MNTFMKFRLPYRRGPSERLNNCQLLDVICTHQLVSLLHYMRFDYEEYSLVGCDAMKSGRSWPTFLRNVLY
jgi:hypothetical protein